MYLQCNESSKEHSKNGCKASEKIMNNTLHRNTGVRGGHHR